MFSRDWWPWNQCQSCCVDSEVETAYQDCSVLWMKMIQIGYIVRGCSGMPDKSLYFLDLFDLTKHLVKPNGTMKWPQCILGPRKSACNGRKSSWFIRNISMMQHLSQKWCEATVTGTADHRTMYWWLFLKNDIKWPYATRLPHFCRRFSVHISL
jgi:hypothetical protein